MDDKIFLMACAVFGTGVFAIVFSIVIFLRREKNDFNMFTNSVNTIQGSVNSCLSAVACCRQDGKDVAQEIKVIKAKHERVVLDIKLMDTKVHGMDKRIAGATRTYNITHTYETPPETLSAKNNLGKGMKAILKDAAR